MKAISVSVCLIEEQLRAQTYLVKQCMRDYVLIMYSPLLSVSFSTLAEGPSPALVKAVTDTL
jgi:polyhydroxyalkanoate synthesis regulator protein